ncbi:MAG: hypothetical protein II207_02600, partial [Clostridia bacterium]|nr:hypothetical protein [Clostridia bacterium]
MKRIGKLFLALSMALTMVATLFSFTAFAADGKSDNEITLNKLLKTGVYVVENKCAGLRCDVNMGIDFPLGMGIVYLPGEAKPA